jgi:hypothetical protein
LEATDAEHLWVGLVLLFAVSFQLSWIFEFCEAEVTGEVDDAGEIDGFRVLVLILTFHFWFGLGLWILLIVQEIFLNFTDNTFDWLHWPIG